MGRHAGHGQTGVGTVLFVIITPALPVGVGHDGLAPHLVEGNILGRMAPAGGDRDHTAHPVRVQRRPLQGLHTAHGAADHGENLVNTKMVQQQGLGFDHVANGDDRKIEPVRFAGGRVDLGRAGGAAAGTQHIGADHIETVGIDRATGADHILPPARFAGDGIDAAHIMIAGQGMADQHHIGLVLIQGAPAFIGHMNGTERGTRIKTQRLVHAKDRHLGNAVILNFLYLCACHNLPSVVSLS